MDGALILLHPERLGWLAVLPLLWWLAQPPRPRAVHWTPHFAAWQQALQTLRRRPPRRRGRRWLLLLLAALGAALAHAEPVWRPAPGPRRLCVVLDGSASMAAAGRGGPPAAVAARQLLRERFAALPPHVEVVLLHAGAALQRRHGAAARALLDLAAPAGGDAVDLAAVAAAAAAADTAVWTLTDGHAGPPPATGALSLLGAPAANTALLAVAPVDHWPLPDLELEVAAVHHGPAPVEVRLRATGALVAPAAAAATLAPGTPTTLRLRGQRTAAGGELRVQIEAPAGDAQPLDDAFALQLPALPAPRLAWLGEADGGPYAEVAARTLAEEVAGTAVAGQPGAAAEFLLVDGGELRLPPGRARALAFGTRFAGAPPAAPVAGAVAADWDRLHPLAAGLDLAELRVQRHDPACLPPGEPWLWTTGAGVARTPLAVVAPAGDGAAVHFAFRLADSNLPLLAAFPQLLRRAFVRCHGAAARWQPRTALPPAAEADLTRPAAAPDRPLPPFGAPERPLAAPCLLAVLVLLALRAVCR